MKDLEAYIERQAIWSNETFGPGSRTGGVVEHIKKELKEIEAAPDDVKEWIDVVILALDGAWRAGDSPSQIATALLSKQTVNMTRTWPDWRKESQDHAIEHVKES